MNGLDENVETDVIFDENKIKIRKAPDISYLEVEQGNGVFGDQVLVGHGEITNEKCGVFSGYYGCDRVDLHKKITLDGVNYNGKVYIRMGYHYCHKPSCPLCFKHGWAVQAAQRINDRVQQARKKYGDFDHIVLSVPIEDYGFNKKQLFEKAYSILQKRGIIGGCVIFHGFRFATFKEAKIRNVQQGWRWSPHFHVIGRILGGYSCCRNCNRKSNCLKGCGGFDDRNYWDGFMKDGYYLKVLSPRKDFFATAWYQLNHCSYDKTKKRVHIVHWFGTCSRRKMKVTPEKRKQLCPICNHELKLMRYVGNDPIIFSWLKHEGYFNYFDSSGKTAWVEAPEKWKHNSGSPEPQETEQQKPMEAIKLKDRYVIRVKQGFGELDNYLITTNDVEIYEVYKEDMKEGVINE